MKFSDYKIPSEVHLLNNLLSLDLSGIQSAMDSELQKGLHRAIDEWKALENRNLYAERFTDKNTIHAITGHISNHPFKQHSFLEYILNGDYDEATMNRIIGQFSHIVENTGRITALCLGKMQDSTPSDHGERWHKITDLMEHILSRSIMYEYSQSSTVKENDLANLSGLLEGLTAIERFQKIVRENGNSVPVVSLMEHGTADYVITMRLLAVSPAFTETESLTAIGMETLWGIPFFYSVLLAGIVRHNLIQGTPIDFNRLEYLSNYIRFTLNHAPYFLLGLVLHSTRSPLINKAVTMAFNSRYHFLSDLQRSITNTRARSIEELDRDRIYTGNDHRIDNELMIARQHAHEEMVLDFKSYRNRKNNPFSYHE